MAPAAIDGNINFVIQCDVIKHRGKKTIDISKTGLIALLNQASIIKAGLLPKSKVYVNVSIADLTIGVRGAPKVQPRKEIRAGFDI